MDIKKTSVASSSVYDALVKFLIFPNLDQSEWWEAAASMLARMLSAAHYNFHQQFQYLYLFATHVIPMLGPFPKSRPGLYDCLLGGLGSLEFSQNLAQSQSLVRIAFEPTSHEASTGEDPCNRGMIDQALRRLKRVSPSLDLQLYHRLIVDLTLSDDDERALIDANELAGRPARTQSLVALDLKDGDIAVKLYLYPELKSAATGTPILQLIGDSMRKVDPGDLFSAGLAEVEDFLRRAPSTLQAYFLSCDLVSPAVTRFKLYLADLQVGFDRITDIWTLGGKLQGEETERGLQMVQDLWEALEIPPGTRAPPDRPTRPGDPPTRLPLLANLELKPRDPWPKLKIYFPLTGLNDEMVATALSSVFRRWGWEDHASTYVENVASYKPDLDLSQSSDFQAWLSFSYSIKTGPYTTMYYH
ncbi:putative dimethylallyl tryptophan synthase [Aspergillus steynii IBT 23096]|uniref:Putative dimethylallyl tryptophan synthase n=1 Tax=Aspergillus steynii IBT 23096 TaxID=1392250 RepID=A0A2I2GGM2_9EURO|nr:putative dimethylallyl tryptophan synthase [Aspergillus steynii IBT 23096]PLB52029.1 putative dimethylallyl tryptophan synthase [Aspergillus steynii IBT 23096]